MTFQKNVDDADIERKGGHTNAITKLGADTSHQNKQRAKDVKDESKPDIDRDKNKDMRCQHERAAIGKARTKKARGKALFKYMRCKKGKK
jgi:hypothetical protein